VNWGVDGESGLLRDMMALGIWEPLAVKAQTYKTAVEVLIGLLIGLLSGLLSGLLIGLLSGLLSFMVDTDNLFLLYRRPSCCCASMTSSLVTRRKTKTVRWEDREPSRSTWIQIHVDPEPHRSHPTACVSLFVCGAQLNET